MEGSLETKPKNPRRVAAGAANGRLAKGKKSPEGRARSALNACTHLLTIKSELRLSYEREEIYDLYRNLLIDSYSPQDPAELNIVLQLAHAYWRLERADMAEKAALELAHENLVQRRTGLPHHSGFYTGAESQFVCLRDVVSSDSFQHLRRYRSEIERSIARFTKLLMDYQKNRRPGPNTPYVTDNQPFDLSREFIETATRQQEEFEAAKAAATQKPKSTPAPKPQVEPEPLPETPMEKYETKVSQDVDHPLKC